MALALSGAYGITSYCENKVVILNNESEQIYGRVAVLITLDAVNFTVFQDLLSSGSLPNISQLIDNGILVLGKTIVPSATCASWAALGTGAPPQINGVVHTYAINSTEYHSLPPDEEPSTLSYKDMIKAESIIEVANRENVITGIIYSESKVSVFFGKNGTPTYSQYISETYDPYYAGLPVSFRKDYLEDLTNSFISMIDNFIPSIKLGKNALFVIDYPEPDASGHTHGPLSDYYREVLSLFDDFVGLIVNHLKETGLWDKTLLIFMTDHSMIQVDPDLNVLTSDMEHLAGLPLEHRVVGIGTLAYIYLKHPEQLEEALSYLKDIDWIESIWVRTPVGDYNKTLDEINLNSSYAGDIVISIKEPHFASQYENKGSHGGINTLNIPIIISGGMCNTSKVLKNGTVRLIDIAPTIAGFMNIDKPKNAVGNDLEVYSNYADLNIEIEPSIAEPNTNVTLSVLYEMRLLESDTSLELAIIKDNSSYYNKTIELTSKTGTKNITIMFEDEGYYDIYAAIKRGKKILGGTTGRVLVVKVTVEESKTPIIASLILSIAIGVVIILTPYFVKKIRIGG